MAVDMFLDLGKDIKGEAQDAKHKGAIDILAWSWGVSQSGTFHGGGGGGAGKANFQDISVTKYVDSSSAALMLYCANGDHFDAADLIVRKAGTNPLEYIKIHMEPVMVTAISTGGSGGEDKLTENVTLNFGKVKLEYFEQKKDGSGEAAKTFLWDIAGNQAK